MNNQGILSYIYIYTHTHTHTHTIVANMANQNENKKEKIIDQMIGQNEHKEDKQSIIAFDDNKPPYWPPESTAEFNIPMSGLLEEGTALPQNADSENEEKMGDGQLETQPPIAERDSKNDFDYLKKKIIVAKCSIPQEREMINDQIQSLYWTFGINNSVKVFGQDNIVQKEQQTIVVLEEKQKEEYKFDARVPFEFRKRRPMKLNNKYTDYAHQIIHQLCYTNIDKGHDHIACNLDGVGHLFGEKDCPIADIIVADLENPHWLNIPESALQILGITSVNDRFVLFIMIMKFAVPALRNQYGITGSQIGLIVANKLKELNRSGFACSDQIDFAFIAAKIETRIRDYNLHKSNEAFRISSYGQMLRFKNRGTNHPQVPYNKDNTISNFTAGPKPRSKLEQLQAHKHWENEFLYNPRSTEDAYYWHHYCTANVIRSYSNRMAHENGMTVETLTNTMEKLLMKKCIFEWIQTSGYMYTLFAPANSTFDIVFHNINLENAAFATAASVRMRLTEPRETSALMNAYHLQMVQATKMGVISSDISFHPKYTKRDWDRVHLVDQNNPQCHGTRALRFRNKNHLPVPHQQPMTKDEEIFIYGFLLHSE